jgi:hypothetical protein
MNPRTTDRIFAALGGSFVVLTLLGTALAGEVHGGSLTDSAVKIAARIANPLPTRDWVGGYLELLSVGCFLAFAAWATTRLGGGVLGQLARLFAACYAAVIVGSLGVMYGTGYAYGHGISVPVFRALDAVNTGTYVASWFLSAFFLLAVGVQALAGARRRLGWSGIGVGVLTLVAAPSTEDFGQLSVLAFFVWVVVASVALARDSRASVAAATAVQHA